jgi:twitching motility protein PilI
VQTRPIDLCEYQRVLLDRIESIEESDVASFHIGFEVGEQLWALPLREASEVTRVPKIASVPGTYDWFLGIANIRGNLYTVSDFALLADGIRTTITADSRLILLSGRYRVEAALLIRRSLGLHRMQGVTQANPPGLPWASATHRDLEGRIWFELNVQRLIQDPRFLEAAS